MANTSATLDYEHFTEVMAHANSILSVCKPKSQSQIIKY